MNYKKTIIYKIVCDNVDILDCYVGQTTNFIQRKAQHKASCNNINSKLYNSKVYKFIRDNGGWYNFSMVEIEKFPCNDVNEARKRERYYIENLQAKLNSNLPSRTPTEYYIENKDIIKEYQIENKDKISEQQKEYYSNNKEKYKEYYKNNVDTIKEQKKEYYKNNVDTIKEQSKEHYKNNAETIKAREKEYRENNKEKIKERQKEYYKNNKEKLKIKQNIKI